MDEDFSLFSTLADEGLRAFMSEHPGGLSDTDEVTWAFNPAMNRLNDQWLGFTQGLTDWGYPSNLGYDTTSIASWLTSVRSRILVKRGTLHTSAWRYYGYATGWKRTIEPTRSRVSPLQWPANFEQYYQTTHAKIKSIVSGYNYDPMQSAAEIGPGAKAAYEAAQARAAAANESWFDKMSTSSKLILVGGVVVVAAVVLGSLR